MIDRIRKPEYFFRPSLLFSRLTRSVDRGYRVVTPSWKLSLSVDPAEEIGRALVQMGVYDLPVSRPFGGFSIPVNKQSMSARTSDT